MTVLRGLSSPRKQIVLEYLRDTQLLNSILNLRDTPWLDSILNDDELSWLLRETNGEANSERVDLQEANLEEAIGSGAVSPGAVSPGADLQEADLEDANLEDANLSGADLYGAILSGAKGLTQGQLEQAFGDEDAELPEHLDRPKSWTEGESNQAKNE